MAQRYDFASDNVAGAMPEVIEALNRFNGGFTASYGEDEVCARAGDLIRELLNVDAEVHFVSSGTAANALTLAALAAPHEAIIAHQRSHLATDETGAPGLFGAGMGIIPAAGPSGRIDQAALATALAQPEGAHWQSPAAISFTNATEFGALYAEADLGLLIGAAKDRDLKIHVDGARLANAAAAGFDLKRLARLGADIVVVGGTKAGSTPTEAIVLIEPSVRRRFGARLKHGGQLVSKSRFLAAPWIGMLETGAWMRRASHANAMAKRLAALVPFPLAHPVEANGVFVWMDEARLERLRQSGWAVERFGDGSVRFMCSWATTAAAIEELAEALRAIA
jgi:threonine aldolase